MNINSILQKVSNSLELTSKEASYIFNHYFGKFQTLAGFLMALATKGPSTISLISYKNIKKKIKK